MAAVLALLAMPGSGIYRFSWLALSLALTLMVARRAVSLVGAVADGRSVRTHRRRGIPGGAAGNGGRRSEINCRTLALRTCRYAHRNGQWRVAGDGQYRPGDAYTGAQRGGNRQRGRSCRAYGKPATAGGSGALPSQVHWPKLCARCLKPKSPSALSTFRRESPQASVAWMQLNPGVFA